MGVALFYLSVHPVGYAFPTLGNGNILQRGKPIYGRTPCQLCANCEQITIHFRVIFYDCSAWGSYRSGEIDGCARFDLSVESLGDETLE